MKRKMENVHTLNNTRLLYNKLVYIYNLNLNNFYFRRMRYNVSNLTIKTHIHTHHIITHLGGSGKYFRLLKMKFRCQISMIRICMICLVLGTTVIFYILGLNNPRNFIQLLSDSLRKCKHKTWLSLLYLICWLLAPT